MHLHSIIIFWLVQLSVFSGSDMPRNKRSVFVLKSNITKSSTNSTISWPKVENPSNKPRFLSTLNTNLNFDASDYQCSSNTSHSCSHKTASHKTKILNEFRRILNQNLLSSSVQSDDFSANPYNVNHEIDLKNYLNQTKSQLICALKEVAIDTIIPKDIPSDKLNIHKWVPKNNIFETKTFNTCAIVASAGSLIGSGLGNFIDDHEVVLRFNHAPVTGYERDVGRKTTFRILNSQVMTQERYSFVNSSLYRGQMVLLGWDPSPMGSTLAHWFAKPEHDLFSAYENYMRYSDNERANEHPTSYYNFFLLNPSSLWNLWKFLQRRVQKPLPKHPPTSGFLGIALLIQRCHLLHVFEYIPSTRLSARCHYFDERTNPACTFGSWHPLAAEKFIAWSMNVADDYTVFQKGYIELNSDVKC